jgi:hypothetical protein
MSNYETALKAERRKVVRCFNHYTTDQMANLAWNSRGRLRRHATGEFYYTHPDVPGIIFRTRGQAAEYALSRRN